MTHPPGLLNAERTAKILIDRHGASALDFAARQLAIQHLANARSSMIEWRAIAMAIERLQKIGPEGGARH